MEKKMRLEEEAKQLSIRKEEQKSVTIRVSELLIELPEYISKVKEDGNGNVEEGSIIKLFRRISFM